MWGLNELYLQYIVDCLDVNIGFLQRCAIVAHFGKHFQQAQVQQVLAGSLSGTDQFPCGQWEKFDTREFHKWRRLDLCLQTESNNNKITVIYLLV